MRKFIEGSAVELTTVFITTLLLTYLVVSPNVDNQNLLFAFKSIAALLVFLPLMTTISLVAGKLELLRAHKWKAAIGSLVLAVLVSLSLGYDANLTVTSVEATKYLLVLLASFSTVFFVPAILKKDRIAAWEDFSAKVRSFVAANIFSAAVLIGSSFALLTVSFLFRTPIDQRTPLTIIVWVLFGLNAVLFLAGLKLGVTKQTVDLNKITEKFAKYVLVPFHILYTAIMYVYLLSILLTGTVPDNQLGGLSLCFALPGIIAIVMLYPLWVNGKDKFTRWYTSFYAINLVPVSGVYFYSLFVRIGEFGFTPDRILGLLVGVFILVLSGLLLWKKAFRLERFGLAVLLVIVVAFYFPVVNINSIARASLEGRLLASLEKYEVIKDGKWIGKQKDIGWEDYRALAADFRYLSNNFPLDFLKGYISEGQLRQISEVPYEYTREQAFMDLTGLNRNSGIDYGRTKLVNIYFDTGAGLDVSGFDKLAEAYLSKDPLIGAESNLFKLTYLGALIEVDLDTYAQNVLKGLADESDRMGSVTISAEEGMNYRIEIASNLYSKMVFGPDTIYATYDTVEDRVQITSLRGKLLVKD
ncbi:MAG: DUF4153 domain-containing protein [Candidatus Doudnabacteria bacterium]|nr:DUF4153 domain-containing protein [Candidatus Doudnabacteria bacterium]